METPINIIKQEKEIKTREQLVIEAYRNIMEVDKPQNIPMTQHVRAQIDAIENFINLIKSDIHKEEYNFNNLKEGRPDKDIHRKEYLKNYQFTYEEEARAHDMLMDLDREIIYQRHLKYELGKIIAILAKNTNWKFFNEIKATEVK